ncbi:MAG: malto-oligosyltrehalose trehalohydrolase [Planctomycetes bacterium]|nr:malto-oligosyltrehalose trehalohydrolase [Planctomycetota bacterium]
MPARLGAWPAGAGRTEFLVWAPRVRRVEVDVLAPRAQRTALLPAARGYHAGVLDDVGPGASYLLRLDGRDGVPDPASRAQPVSVHGPSVVAAKPRSAAALRTPPALRDLVVYELHVGTATAAGTFDAAAGLLPGLRDLGVTAIELMPVASFPGERNWGYDGVLPFAVQHSYGGVDGLVRLVDAAHARGIAVLVDVVYNHFGPEGNYLDRFGPYFTDGNRTPWGAAINFDGPGSDEVRRFFIEHALFLVDDCGVDGLRLDATHAMHDRSALPFLEAITAAVHARAAARGRRVWMIAETDQNDPRYVLASAGGGLGMDAFWCDDLHHALHVALTGESDGYYAGFQDLALLARAWAEGMAYQGEYSAYRDHSHGRPAGSLRPEQVVVCAQNHDQIGNRMRGERLTALVAPAALPLAAATVLTSPCTPLLFMGEEHAERQPFLYFTSHGDEALADAVRAGRKREFAAFAAHGEPPDPQAEDTFRRSVLTTPDADGRRLRATYRELLDLRKALPSGAAVATVLAGRVVHGRRGAGDAAVHVLLHFGDRSAVVALPADCVPAGGLRRRWDSIGAASAVPTHVTPATGALTLAPWQAVVLSR